MTTSPSNQIADAIERYAKGERPPSAGNGEDV